MSDPRLTSTLASLWHLDETAVADADTISDSSPKGNNLISVNGASVVAGKRNNAFNFNGTSQYLKQRVFATQLGTLAYLGNDTTTAQFEDAGQDFSAYQTTSGNATYMIAINNSDNSICFGYLGTASGVGNKDITIYTTKARSVRGWISNSSSLVLPIVGSKVPATYKILKTDLQITGNLTIGAWIKPTSTSSSHHIIVSKYGTTSPNVAYRLERIGTSLYTFINGTTRQSSNVIVAGNWYYVVSVYNASAQTLDLYVNGILNNGTLTGVVPSSINDMPAVLSVGADINMVSSATQYYFDGIIDETFVIAGLLTPAQVMYLYQHPSASAYGQAAQTFSIQSPAPYQTFQRNGSNLGNIVVQSVLPTTDAVLVEGNWNGSGWVSLGMISGGILNTTMTSQAAGQGVFQLRCQGRVVSSHHVGIGDVFIISGQSNNSGRGTNNQVYSHGTLKAVIYGNDYTWKELADPVDSNVGQVDSVSSDSSAAGSIWPLIATSHMASQSVPCAFVPCAMGGTSITAWQPGADHTNRATLYGSMNYRAAKIGGYKAICWWQGETDADVAMPTATYQANMDTIVAALTTDLPGLMFLPIILESSNGLYSDANALLIQTAIQNVIAEAHPNVASGGDLSALRPGVAGDYHFRTNAELVTVSNIVWNGIKTAFGW